MALKYLPRSLSLGFAFNVIVDSSQTQNQLGNGSYSSFLLKIGSWIQNDENLNIFGGTAGVLFVTGN